MSSEILSQYECSEVISQKMKTTDYQIVDFNIQPLAEVAGFLGDHYNLQINILYKNELKKLRFFVKCMAVTDSQKSIIMEGGAFYKEEQMFKKLIPHLLKSGIEITNECVPLCYLVRSMEMFVFEDLSSLGYKILNHRESLTLDAVKLALSAIAKFNACGLIMEEKITKATGKPYRMYSDYEQEFKEAFYYPAGYSTAFVQSAVKGTLTAIEYFGTSRLHTDIQALKKFAQDAINEYVHLVLPSKEFRNATCHGDLWAGNIMFKFEDDKPVGCKLIDFQSYRYAPPAQDLMTFLYLVTDRNFRKSHVKDVFQFYYKELGDVLQKYDVKIEDVFSHEEYVRSCDYYRLFGVAQAVTHFQVIMTPAEEIKKIFVVSENVQKIWFEDRSEHIVRMCDSYPVYRENLCNILIELRDLRQSLENL